MSLETDREREREKERKMITQHCAWGNLKENHPCLTTHITPAGRQSGIELVSDGKYGRGWLIETQLPLVDH